MTKQRILIVDDSKSMRQQLSEALATAGYDIVEAENGLEGTNIINSDSGLSMVIVDINMPQMNGLEMLDQI